MLLEFASRQTFLRFILGEILSKAESRLYHRPALVRRFLRICATFFRGEQSAIGTNCIRRFGMSWTRPLTTTRAVQTYRWSTRCPFLRIAQFFICQPEINRLISTNYTTVSARKNHRNNRQNAAIARMCPHFLPGFSAKTPFVYVRAVVRKTF